MRTCSAFCLALFLATGLLAQTRGTRPIVVGTTGSVVHPAGPAGTGGITRGTPSVVNPGGGGVHLVVPGQNFRRNPAVSSGRNTAVYAYPVYIGGDYDSSYISEQAPMASQTQPNITVIYPPQPAPVIINHIYPGGSPSYPDTAQSQTVMPMQQARDDSSASTSEPSHYLIAFKDRTIYSAAAYWLDGDTLHYFTNGNTHNQVSLSLVDRELTERLNKDAGVTVKLPAPAK